MNYKELKDLNLSSNQIIDLKIFEKTKFGKLKFLDLRNNLLDQIKDMKIIKELKSKIKMFIC